MNILWKQKSCATLLAAQNSLNTQKNLDFIAINGNFIDFFLQKRLSELSLIFLFSVALSQNPENVFSYFQRTIEIISH